MSRTPTRVLVVDDSQATRDRLTALLEELGHVVDTAEDGRRALALLDAGANPDAVLLDVGMPDPDGMSTLSQIRERSPALPVLMVSSDGMASTIVEAMQRGATDYLPKPPDAEELARALDAALEEQAIAHRYEVLRKSEPHADALFEGAALAQIRETLEKIADTDVSVLITGESGTGKEVIARAVHAQSSRAEKAWIKVNCAALPGGLLESELFGYEKGAFTGATARRTGKFEAADGGTIFLDEIGEMSPAAQAKLLHVVQDGAFHRLGGNREIRVDVRVVSATNRPLDGLVGSEFREDLYFRLNVVGLRLPALRERREDIPAFVEHLLARASARYRRPIPRISPALLAAFERHPFPGNIRELENLLKRVVVMGSEEPILSELLRKEQAGKHRAERLRDFMREAEAQAGEMPLLEVGRRAALEAERNVIETALLATHWNRRKAALQLGVSYKTFLQKVRRCGLQPDA